MARLVVKCTWGADRPEACLQAFTVATTAIAAGVEVSLWLTGEAALLAIASDDDIVIPHSPPLSALRDIVLADGTLTLCTQCAARRGIEPQDVLPGVRIAGSALFVEEALAPETTALVY